jgi:hypothetical protein
MWSEPHNIILGNIEWIPVFIDNNPVGTDDTWNPIPPLYKKEGNIWRHFLYPDITIEFVS